MKKEAMSSRERVLAAVRGLPVDRVPVMYWFNPHATCRLISEFQGAESAFWNFTGKRFWKSFSTDRGLFSRELRIGLPHLIHEYGNQAYALQLGSDIAILRYGTSKYWNQKIYRENGRILIRDSFGSTRGLGGIYLDIIIPAIKSIDDIKNFKFVDLSDDKHYAQIRKFREKYPDACIIVENFGVQDLLSTQIWTMEQFMLALYDYPEELKEFQRRFADYMIDIANRSVRAGADIVFIYDDYGTTDTTLISMDMWREFTFPHLKRQVAAVHDAGALAMLHSCGFQTPFLDYYVDAEIDVLQSLQPKAGNDFKTAYTKYGDKLGFATGIDIQKGEKMTPEELHDDIVGAYRIGGYNGKHILGMTHMMQYTMPEKNIETIFNTVRDIQNGNYD